MARDVSSFVERYQQLYERDPDSKVFAPLAEAYRRMGLIDEAIDLAEKGVKRHPHFASGRVALGKCFVQKKEYDKAVEHLKTAVDLSPENLLAHQLLAECYARLRRPMDALNAYKMVLFLNPHDGRVADLVRKLETQIYADAAFGDAEEFSMEKLGTVREGPTHKQGAAKNAARAQMAGAEPGADEAMTTKQELDGRDFERELALLDARYDRGDWAVVREQLNELLKKYPEHPELIQRKANLDEMTQGSFHLGEFLSPINPEGKKSKIEKLEKLLAALEGRKRES
jgi:tetratricopeptide (TPR) repeat protein